MNAHAKARLKQVETCLTDLELACRRDASSVEDLMSQVAACARKVVTPRLTSCGTGIEYHHGARVMSCAGHALLMHKAKVPHGATAVLTAVIEARVLPELAAMVTRLAPKHQGPPAGRCCECCHPRAPAWARRVAVPSAPPSRSSSAHQLFAQELKAVEDGAGARRATVSSTLAWLVAALAQLCGAVLSLDGAFATSPQQPPSHNASSPQHRTHGSCEVIMQNLSQQLYEEFSPGTSIMDIMCVMTEQILTEWQPHLLQVLNNHEYPLLPCAHWLRGLDLRETVDSWLCCVLASLASSVQLLAPNLPPTRQPPSPTLVHTLFLAQILNGVQSNDELHAILPASTPVTIFKRAEHVLSIGASSLATQAWLLRHRSGLWCAGTKRDETLTISSLEDTSELFRTAASLMSEHIEQTALARRMLEVGGQVVLEQCKVMEGMPRIRGGYINSCSMDSVMAALYHLTKHPVTECGPVLPPAGAGAADAPGDCAGRWARVVAATRPCLTTCAWYGWAWIMRQLAVKEGQGRSALSESAAKMRPHVRRMADHLALIRQRIQGSGQAGRGQGCELKQAVGCGRIAGDMDCGQWAVGGCGGVPCPEDVCAALVAGAWVLAAGYPVNRDHQQAAPGNSSSAVVLISELLQLYCCARDALFSGKGPRRVCKAWQDAMVRYNVAKEMLQVWTIASSLEDSVASIEPYLLKWNILSVACLACASLQTAVVNLRATPPSSHRYPSLLNWASKLCSDFPIWVLLLLPHMSGAAVEDLPSRSHEEDREKVRQGLLARPAPSSARTLPPAAPHSRNILTATWLAQLLRSVGTCVTLIAEASDVKFRQGRPDLVPPYLVLAMPLLLPDLMRNLLRGCQTVALNEDEVLAEKQAWLYGELNRHVLGGAGSAAPPGGARPQPTAQSVAAQPSGPAPKPTAVTPPTSGTSEPPCNSAAADSDDESGSMDKGSTSSGHSAACGGSSSRVDASELPGLDVPSALAVLDWVGEELLGNEVFLVGTLQRMVQARAAASGTRAKQVPPIARYSAAARAKYIVESELCRRVWAWSEKVCKELLKALEDEVAVDGSPLG